MTEDSRPDGWSITVVRSGGFAGLNREWRVQTADAPDVDWGTLIYACPWSEPARPSTRADGFVWHVDAATRGRSCSATLNDDQVSGAWKALVDEVRTRRRN